MLHKKKIQMVTALERQVQSFFPELLKGTDWKVSK